MARLEEFDDVQLDVEFTQAGTRSNLTSKENIAISFGKIAKWYEALVPTGGSSGQFLGFNSSGTAKWVSNPNVDEKVKAIKLAQSTADASYYPTLVAGEGTAGVSIIDSAKINHTPGTTSIVGNTRLILGNGINEGTTNNEAGLLRIYSSGTKYHTLKGAKITTDNVDHTLPTTGGTILNTGTTSFTQTLSSGTKIGTIKINGTSSDIYAPTDTDTKVTDTVGTANTYYPAGGTSTSTATGTQVFDTSLKFIGTTGSTSAVGKAQLVLGNATASGTANNKQGSIVVYGSTAYAHTIQGAPTAARTLTLPDKTGTFALTSDIPSVPTVNDAALTLKGAGTTVTTFTANASSAKSLDIVAGSNVTVTADATNAKISIASSHPTITKSTDTTSTASPAHGGTFTVVDSITREANGHVTKINTKTVTLPADSNTDTKVTQTNTTTSADYRVLLSGNANDTTETTTGRKSAKLTFNPSSGGLYSFGFLWTDITGQTLDINTLTLSDGTLHSRRFIEKTNGGASNITNIPVTGYPFLLEVDLIRWGSTTDYITRQRFTNAANGAYSYVRYCTNGTWGSWTTRRYTDTDTKVTSSANHYTPATVSGQDKSASASGATAAWSIDVVKGVTLNTDGKGHVTGLSVTSGKIPANPIPSNNVTGSGTSGYLTKWNGTNTITNGPQLGSSTTTFLRNDGTWATPTNTDTKVTQSATTTTNYRPILFGAKDSTDISTLANTVTDQAYTSTKMFAKPDTGYLYASGFSTSSYINGTGAQLAQYGLYLRSYKSASLPAGGNYSYAEYAIRVYDGKATYNSGMLLTIDGGGLTIVGGGESAKSLAALISDDQRDSNTSRTRLDVGGTLNTAYHGSEEQLILSSDNNIYFLTTCQTIANRKPVVLDVNSYFYPGTTKTGSIGTSSYMWNSVYAATIYENGTSLASKYAAIGHTHGLVHSNLNQMATNGTTGGWSVIGIDPAVNGYVLKSIRINGTSPNWLSGDYGAGIAFGGHDTKGVISMKYGSPVITFAGGNHSSSKTEPTWYLKISGTSGSTYNLANFYDSTISRTANTVLAAPNGSNGAASFRKLVAADIPSHTHSYLPLSGTTINNPNTSSVSFTNGMTGNILFANTGNTNGVARGIGGIVGTTDSWSVRGYQTGENKGCLEISVGDDGDEGIYVRQYTSGAYKATFSNNAGSASGLTYRELVLMAPSTGASTFPSDVTLSGGILYLSGGNGGYGQINLKTASYNVMLRQDNANTYFLVTAKDDPNGGWTTARPLTINNSTGICSINGNAANVTGTVAIAHGGTGATTRLAALRALTEENVGTSAQYFLTITDSWGKGGYTTVANAKTVLGLGSAAYTASTDYLSSSTKYAASSSVGGPATNVAIARVSKDSKAFPGANKVVFEEYTNGASYNLPGNHYYHIMSAQGNDTNYGTQLALGMTATAAYYRVYNNKTWSDWKSLINTDTTYSANNGVGLSGTTFYNSGVRAVSTGSANGTISVNTNGTSADVAVKGLASAAYVTQESLLRARSTVSVDGGATGWSQIGINQYKDAYPDGVTNKIYGWGAVVSMPAPNARFDLYYNHNSSTADRITNGLQYRTGWNDDKKAWRMLIDNVNYTEYMPYKKPIKFQFNNGITNGYWAKLFSANCSSYNILEIDIVTYHGYSGNFRSKLHIKFTNAGFVPGESSIISHQNIAPDSLRITQDDTNTFSLWIKCDGISSRFGYEILNISDEGSVFFNGVTLTAARWSFPTTFTKSDTAPTNAVAATRYFALDNHTHNYAGSSSAGGAATSANILNKNNAAGATTTGVQYANGQLTVGTADGNAVEGSNGSYKLWSYPAGGTAVGGGTANIQNLRLYCSSAYFRDIFISPNNYDIYHRSVAAGTAQPWRKILDSGNYKSYALPRNIKHIHTASGKEGSVGWVKIARITVTADYPNHPMTFTIAQRGVMQYRIHLVLKNYSVASAAISEFIIARDNSWTDTNNYPRAYIIKPSDGIFDLYIRKTENYDHIFVVDFTKADGCEGDNYSVTWTNVHAADSEITGGTEAVKKLYLLTTTKYAGSSSPGGAATRVATEVGSSAGARPVFYAYLNDNTRVVYNTNFTYNPSGNVLKASTFDGEITTLAFHNRIYALSQTPSGSTWNGNETLITSIPSASGTSTPNYQRVKSIDFIKDCISDLKEPVLYENTTNPSTNTTIQLPNGIPKYLKVFIGVEYSSDGSTYSDSSACINCIDVDMAHTRHGGFIGYDTPGQAGVGNYLAYCYVNVKQNTGSTTAYTVGISYAKFLNLATPAVVQNIIARIVKIIAVY